MKPNNWEDIKNLLNECVQNCRIDENVAEVFADESENDARKAE